MTTPHQQFHNKAQAKDAMRTMLSRANRAETLADSPRAMSQPERRALLKAADDYRAEIERIRHLFPTLPE